ncbi:MAG TPA: uL15 family ribosomal protein [Candidatus Woesebacteria bacterium]|nr:uL15 family ribosomal protein [Candidatus Woesebacteria bacterium]
MNLILSHLEKITNKPARRLGRGYGSKKGGHTSGRGQKGDKSRGKVPLIFDGTKVKKGYIKRLPFLRGKHRLGAKTKPQAVSLDYLEAHFKEGETVKFDFPVKILANGKIKKKLVLKDIPMSASARKKINE